MGADVANAAAATAALRVDPGTRADVAMLRALCAGCGDVVDLALVGRRAGEAWAATGFDPGELVAWLGFRPRHEYAALHHALDGRLSCDVCHAAAATNGEKRPKRPRGGSGRSKGR